MEWKKDRAEELLKLIAQLDAVEFFGICQVVGVDVYKEENVEENVECASAKKEPKEFDEIWGEVCDKVATMNRVRRRNLGKLVRAAVKGK